VIDRAQAVANALGSLRLDGLEPTGPVRELADLWAQGKASDADLREAERRLLSGEALVGSRKSGRLELGNAKGGQEGMVSRC
jgi:hypothetical protein